MKMKMMTTVLAFAMSISVPAWAAEMTKGEVQKVDEKLMKVTIKHEALKNLDMPAMTMVFKIPDAAILAKLKAGAAVKFVADRVNGQLTVTEVQ